MADGTRELEAQDAWARERALDATRSFLVQAPAGSGKTGLLIQRFLALLAHVERPERIVAMTFTRKAAGEMRERIVEALGAAAIGAPVPLDAHARRTHELALAALAQDRRLGWQLLAHPSRLAIDTIDAIAAGFARQAPVTTGFGALPRYVDDATELYAEAASAALAHAAGDDAAWRALVAHDDNRADSIVALLAELLAKRDQWLRALPATGGAPLREAIERALAQEVDDELARAQAAIAAHAGDLARSLRHAAAHLDGGAANALARCAAAGGVPPVRADHLGDWTALADWLLVKGDARLRRSVDKRHGFPAANGRPGAARAKDDMEAVLRALDADPDIAAALDAVRKLPPARLGEHAWRIVDALLAVLRGVAARLSVTFAEHGRIDFVEGALAALRALGEPDAPSDLLLRLDGAIEHLLIDEFQDTSLTQLDMIERLTAGWTPGDGRTLFAVGDPMQSIYRFRAAEVRLFVEAQQRARIVSVPIERLALARNFRSQANLVEWTNAAFARVLGAHSDPVRSVVAFSAASAQVPALAGVQTTFDACQDVAGESRAVVARVQQALDAGDASVAILVRTRRHAEPLLPALRDAGIVHTAVELDAFGDTPVVRDLTALAHALLQPADRLAWLAVLRAPWCGLALADLAAIAASAPAPGPSPIDALASASSLDRLSDDGRARLSRTADVLLAALASRGRASLAARVRRAWLALGGPACVADASELDAAERFLLLLAEHERAGDIADWQAFVGALSRLREGDPPPDVRVRVMTLHKAKGLEFDTVVLAALARPGGKSPPQLLRWRRRPHGLLIAPGSARGADPDPVCAYLARLAADEEAAELGRLLYVGCTRAKRRLHLTATLRVRRDGVATPCWVAPPSGSALARLWPIVGGSVAPPADLIDTEPPRPRAALSRVPAGWRPAPPPPGLDSPRELDAAGEAPAFDWARETARHVGVVVHRVLARIADEGIAAWSGARIDALAPWLAVALAGEGVDAPELEGAIAQAREALHAVLADARGRWLLDASHADARSEWALAGIDGDTLVHRTLDRTFVADGVRWIVDFKTGRHEGGDVDAFLDRERERYAPALDAYARLVSAIDPRPIRLALYHPLLRGWREWPFAGY
jgi:ATP-dependent exoDNAse (exonuclease V) beta subunit